MQDAVILSQHFCTMYDSIDLLQMCAHLEVEFLK